MRIRIHKNKKNLLLLYILIPALLLTVSVLTQPQRMLQFAQETFTEPPLFGCLQVGEGNPGTCASKLGKAITQTLTMHSRPVDKQVVYYGDTITGAVEFSNVGDLPIDLSYVGLVGQSQLEKDYFVYLLPAAAQTTIEKGKSVKADNAAYRFNSPDPNGEWIVTTDIEDTAGNKAIAEDKQTKFTVNATCTALRAKELTASDKTSLQALCADKPDSKLCSSRQYCEIFKGENCTQPNVSKETPKWQCDEYVYLPQPEQDLLEELCRVYPDADACKNFCERSIGSNLCPDKYLFIETITGKPVTYFHPRVLYVKIPDGFKFTYSENYPTDRVKMSVETLQTLDTQTFEETNLAAQPVGCAPDRPHLCNIPPPPAAAGPGSACGPGQVRLINGRCGPANSGNKSPIVGQPGPRAPVGPGSACGPGQVRLINGRCGPANSGNKSPIVGLPSAPPPCPAGQRRLRSGSCGFCEPGDIQCEARKIKALSAQCPKGQSGQAGTYVPGKGCRTIPPPPPAKPVKGPPPACGIPGKPKCDLEKNNQAPDPLKGRIADPATCNPDGTPKPPATKCTSLTVPESAEQGDFGYAKHCKSSRQDQNPNDDPPGAPQFACCANALSLREGCCGQHCTVWSQKAKPDGTIDYRDGTGRVCTNTPGADKDAVLKTNTCGPNTKKNPGAERARVIPKDLEGTGGSNPPPGFIPTTRGGAPAPKVDRPAPLRLTPQGACAECPTGYSCGAPEAGPHCIKQERPEPIKLTPQGACAECPTGYSCGAPEVGPHCIPNSGGSAPAGVCQISSDCPARHSCNSNGQGGFGECILLPAGECRSARDCSSTDEVCDANFKCVRHPQGCIEPLGAACREGQTCCGNADCRNGTCQTP